MSGWGSIYNNTRYALGQHTNLLAKLQEQISSGMRVVRASDDPSSANRIMHLQTSSISMGRYRENLSNVELNLEQVYTIIDNVSDSLVQVQQLMTQAATGTYDETNRAVIAGQVNTILDHVFSLANTKSLGEYIFGGANVTNASYQAEYENGKIKSVSYQGSSENLLVPVAPGVELSGRVVGDEVFRSSNRQAPTFLGNTGAAAGSGTASARGDIFLTVTHDTTTYLAAGVLAGDGTSSDTIVGDGHTLTISCDAGAGGWAKLDNGNVVNFTDGETNVLLENADGEVVHIDTSAVGTYHGAAVGIHATAKFSIDDGTSTTDVDDFTATNVRVENADTGKIIYIDVTSLNKIGIEPIRIPGTYDEFGTLISVRNMMENTRDLSLDEQIEMISQSLDSISEVISGVTQSMGSIGGQIQAMDHLDQSLESI